MKDTLIKLFMDINAFLIRLTSGRIGGSIHERRGVGLRGLFTQGKRAHVGLKRRFAIAFDPRGPWPRGPSPAAHAASRKRGGRHLRTPSAPRAP